MLQDLGNIFEGSCGSEAFRTGSVVLGESRGSPGDEIQGLVELFRESEGSVGDSFTDWFSCSARVVSMATA